ncbi:MAG: T9SS type A sorting domain-containing protein [Cytophagaceae bacterium]|nr:T9SS type A sorting domain-containing protein [Cytophagaceae bacterium]
MKPQLFYLKYTIVSFFITFYLLLFFKFESNAQELFYEKNISNGSSLPDSFCFGYQIGNQFWFGAFNDKNYSEFETFKLSKSTDSGLTRVKSFEGFGASEDFYKIGNSVIQFYGNGEKNLLVLDGISINLIKLGNGVYVNQASIKIFKNRLFFLARTFWDSPEDLYVTDGTENGTKKLKLPFDGFVLEALMANEQNLFAKISNSTLKEYDLIGIAGENENENQRIKVGKEVFINRNKIFFLDDESKINVYDISKKDKLVLDLKVNGHVFFDSTQESTFLGFGNKIIKYLPEGNKFELMDSLKNESISDFFKVGQKGVFFSAKNSQNEKSIYFRSNNSTGLKAVNLAKYSKLNNILWAKEIGSNIYFIHNNIFESDDNILTSYNVSTGETQIIGFTFNNQWAKYIITSSKVVIPVRKKKNSTNDLLIVDSDKSLFLSDIQEKFNYKDLNFIGFFDDGMVFSGNMAKIGREPFFTRFEKNDAVLINDIKTDSPEGSGTSNLFQYGSDLYFTVEGQNHSFNIIKTNGNKNSILEIDGSDYGEFNMFFSLNDRLYFIAGYSKVYEIDTSGKIKLVSSIPNSNNSFSYIVLRIGKVEKNGKSIEWILYNGNLFFFDGNNVSVSSAGQLRSINNYLLLNNEEYFVVYNGSKTSVYKLVTSTNTFQEIYSSQYFNYFSNFSVQNGYLYFVKKLLGESDQIITVYLNDKSVTLTKLDDLIISGLMPLEDSFYFLTYNKKKNKTSLFELKTNSLLLTTLVEETSLEIMELSNDTIYYSFNSGGKRIIEFIKKSNRQKSRVLVLDSDVLLRKESKIYIGYSFDDKNKKFDLTKIDIQKGKEDLVLQSYEGFNYIYNPFIFKEHIYFIGDHKNRGLELFRSQLKTPENEQLVKAALILNQPQDSLIFAKNGGILSLEIENNAGVNYEWQLFKDGSWDELKSVSDYFKVNQVFSNELIISNFNILNDVIKVRCKISKDGFDELFTSEISIFQKMEILNHPISGSYLKGEKVNLKSNTNINPNKEIWETDITGEWKDINLLKEVFPQMKIDRNQIELQNVENIENNGFRIRYKAVIDAPYQNVTSNIAEIKFLSPLNTEPKVSEILIFPNPSNKILSFNKTYSQCFIIDQSGNQYFAGSNLLQVDISKLSNGIYFVVLKDKNSSIIRKFSKL